MSAGVASEEIASDYALTASIAGRLMVRLKANAMARGLDEAVSTRLLSSEPAAMLTFLRHIEDRYGGFQNYLIGGAAKIPKIQLILKRFLTDLRLSQPAANGT